MKAPIIIKLMHFVSILLFLFKHASYLQNSSSKEEPGCMNSSSGLCQILSFPASKCCKYVGGNNNLMTFFSMVDVLWYGEMEYQAKLQIKPKIEFYNYKFSRPFNSCKVQIVSFISSSPPTWTRQSTCQGIAKTVDGNAQSFFYWSQVDH